MTPIAPASSANAAVAVQHPTAVGPAASAPTTPTDIDDDGDNDGPATVINLSVDALLFLAAFPFGIGFTDDENAFLVAEEFDAAQSLKTRLPVGTTVNITV